MPGRIAQKVRGRHDATSLIRDEGRSIDHPGSTMNSPGSRSNWLITVLTETDAPGTTAAA